MAAALAAGVAVYVVPEPIATALRAEPRPLNAAEVAIPIPPPPEDEIAATRANAPPAAPDDVALDTLALAAASNDGESDTATPMQLADAAPLAGGRATAAVDPDWRIAINVAAADRCALTVGDDCAQLAIRYRVWDFSVEFGDGDDEPLIAAATPVEVDADAPRAAALPAATDEAAAAPTPRVIAPPPAVSRIPALRMAPPTPAPSFAVTPPPPPEEPRRSSWWRSSRAAMQVAPNAYLDVGNIVGSADPPRHVRGSDGAVASFEGGAQEAATPRVRFGLSIPLETLARNRDHRAAALPPPSFAGGPQN